MKPFIGFGTLVLGMIFIFLAVNGATSVGTGISELIPYTNNGTSLNISESFLIESPNPPPGLSISAYRNGSLIKYGWDFKVPYAPYVFNQTVSCPVTPIFNASTKTIRCGDYYISVKDITDSGFQMTGSKIDGKSATVSFTNASWTIGQSAFLDPTVGYYVAAQNWFVHATSCKLTNGTLIHIGTTTVGGVNSLQCFTSDNNGSTWLNHTIYTSATITPAQGFGAACNSGNNVSVFYVTSTNALIRNVSTDACNTFGAGTTIVNVGANDIRWPVPYYNSTDGLVIGTRFYNGASWLNMTEQANNSATYNHLMFAHTLDDIPGVAINGTGNTLLSMSLDSVITDSFGFYERTGNGTTRNAVLATPDSSPQFSQLCVDSSGVGHMIFRGGGSAASIVYYLNSSNNWTGPFKPIAYNVTQFGGAALVCNGIPVVFVAFFNTSNAGASYNLSVINASASTGFTFGTPTQLLTNNAGGQVVALDQMWPMAARSYTRLDLWHSGATSGVIYYDNYNFSNVTDIVPPTTTATLIDQQGKTPTDPDLTAYIDVTLICDDGVGSGCNETQYCLDTTDTCTPATNYSSPVRVYTQNVSYIRFNSSDKAGNTEVPKSQKLNIIAYNITNVITFTSIVYETNLTNATGNISISSNITAISAWLNYSGTLYAATITGSGNLTANASYRPPLQAANNTAKTLNWTYQLTWTNGTEQNISTSSSTQNVLWAYFPSSVAMPPIMLENTNDTGNMTIFNDLNLATFTALLGFNGTNWTLSQISTTFFENQTITIPILTTTSQNFTVNGSLNVTYGGITFTRNITGTNVTVYQFTLTTNCTGSVPAINFTLADELTGSTQNFSIFNTITDLYTSDPSFHRSYSFNIQNNASSEAFCIIPANFTANSSWIITYQGIGYPARGITETYLNLVSAYTNQTRNVTLYAVNGSYYEFIVENTYGIPIQSASIQTFRNTVFTQSMLTNPDGTAILLFQPLFPYLVIVSAPGYISNTFNYTPPTLAIAPMVIKLNPLSNVSVNNSVFNNISYSLYTSPVLNNTYSNNSFIIFSNVTDNSNNLVNWGLTIVRTNYNGTFVTVYTNTSTSASGGLMQYSVSAVGRYTATGWFNSSIYGYYSYSYAWTLVNGSSAWQTAQDAASGQLSGWSWLFITLVAMMCVVGFISIYLGGGSASAMAGLGVMWIFTMFQPNGIIMPGTPITMLIASSITTVVTLIAMLVESPW